jgi:hypothetical protein
MELQVITALSLISAFYKSLGLFSVFTSLSWQRFYTSLSVTTAQPHSCHSFLRNWTANPQLTLSIPQSSTQLAWGPRYIASGRIQKKSPLPTILPLLGVVAETCLPSRCLAIYVSSGSTIPAFRRHVTIFNFRTAMADSLIIRHSETLQEVMVLEATVRSVRQRNTRCFSA